MRTTFCTIAVLAAAIPAAALAQVADLNTQSRVVAQQTQQAHILNGVWNIGWLGELTLTTQPDGVIVGQLGARPCQGQYRDNSFSILCVHERRGPLLITGEAREEPPVNTRARALVLARPARMS